MANSTDDLSDFLNISQKIKKQKQHLKESEIEFQQYLSQNINNSELLSNNVSRNKNCSFKSSHPIQSINQTRLLKQKVATDKNKMKNNTTYKCESQNNYSKEEIRNYICKQKEMRLLQLKYEIKEKQKSIELRKQSLKELRQKSALILARNLKEKRRRTPKVFEVKNVEKNIQDVKNSEIKDKIKDNIQEHLMLEKNNEKIGLDDNQRHIIAAIKIQSYYRGQKQKKIFKKMVEANDKDKNVIALKSKEGNSLAKKNVENVKLIHDLFPYPYNFITSFKNKLKANCTKTFSENKEKFQISSKNNLTENILLKDNNKETDVDKLLFIKKKNCEANYSSKFDVIDQLNVINYLNPKLHVNLEELKEINTHNKEAYDKVKSFDDNDKIMDYFSNLQCLTTKDQNLSKHESGNNFSLFEESLLNNMVLCAPKTDDNIIKQNAFDSIKKNEKSLVCTVFPQENLKYRHVGGNSDGVLENYFSIPNPKDYVIKTIDEGFSVLSNKTLLNDRVSI